MTFIDFRTRQALKKLFKGTVAVGALSYIYLRFVRDTPEITLFGKKYRNPYFPQKHGGGSVGPEPLEAVRAHFENMSEKVAQWGRETKQLIRRKYEEAKTHANLSP